MLLPAYLSAGGYGRQATYRQNLHRERLCKALVLLLNIKGHIAYFFL